MWKSSFTMIFAASCLVVFPFVLVPGARASAIPVVLTSTTFTIPSNQQQPMGQVHQAPEVNSANVLPLPNSFDLIASKKMTASFENSTSLLRGNLHQRFYRMKRDACKRRPETEVMEYYELKLANRCWDDCDCRPGRYCTPHSWCHDLKQ